MRDIATDFMDLCGNSIKAAGISSKNNQLKNRLTKILKTYNGSFDFCKIGQLTSLEKCEDFKYALSGKHTAPAELVYAVPACSVTQCVQLQIL